ncbi:MAG: nitrous oxide reductase family maturation protein NosD [Promethearchaeota archaeon]
MKHRKILILLVFSLSLLSFGYRQNMASIDFESREKISLNKSLQYVSQSPIYISHNDNFSTYAISGDGGKNNPWMITGYNITSNTNILIHIQDTTDYFDISGNLLDGIDRTYDGIALSNVVNGSISNNTIRNSYYGIFLNNSVYNIISNNSVYYNHEDGLYLHDSSNNAIIHNLIHNNGQNPGGSGIFLDPSNHNLIINNTIFNNSKHGILLNRSDYNIISSNNVSHNHEHGMFLYYSNYSILSWNQVHSNGENPGGSGIFLDPSNHNTIFNNVIFNNNKTGITLNASEYNIVSSNNVSYNHEDGLFLKDSSFNAISNNLIHNNGVNPGGSGIFLDPSHYNTIDHNSIFSNGLAAVNISTSSGSNQIVLNNFINNGPGGGESQAYDDGLDNSFQFNYWNDHTNTDNNQDGIADTAYNINGTANNKDEYPKVNQFVHPTPSPYFITYTTTVTVPFGETETSTTKSTESVSTSSEEPIEGWPLALVLFSIITLLFLRKFKQRTH